MTFCTLPSWRAVFIAASNFPHVVQRSKFSLPLAMTISSNSGYVRNTCPNYASEQMRSSRTAAAR
eukprot:6195936-Pleurochrysis_carterae.AAC.1